MASKHATIVIVHGAWVSGWRWRGFSGLLADRGHRVFTPTLTGLGERAHRCSPSVNLALHAGDVANVIKFERLQNILLVGHSYGGMPTSVAAELVPAGIIRSIMYLDAFCPEDGQSLNDLVPGPPQLPETQGDHLGPAPRANLVGLNTEMEAAARAAYEGRRMPQSAYCFAAQAGSPARGTSARRRHMCSPPARRMTPSGRLQRSSASVPAGERRKCRVHTT